MLAVEPNTVVHDRYLVVQVIGRGGMGIVYEAVDQRLGSRVALKHNLISGGQSVKAFEREAKLLAQLQHPALPRVTDYFSEGSNHFLVMDLIPGENLAELLSRRKCPFDSNEVIECADQLLRILQYLHRQLPVVVHRDVKPQNLKKTPAGRFLLLDFGMAKGGIALSDENSSRSLQGCTPGYAPVEQLYGMTTEPRSDIFSLGATLHHLLTGRRPIDALTRAADLLNRRPDPYRPAHELNPSVPIALSNFVARMLALAVNDRPHNADALVAELPRVAEQAQPTTASHQFETMMSDPPTVAGVATPTGNAVSPALRRAQTLARVLRGSRVLWVDDNPQSVLPFCGILSSIGVTVDLVMSSSEALKMTVSTRYQLIISDIERDGIADEGLAFLSVLRRRTSVPRVVFFIANLDPGRGTPPGAFGITNSGEELLHLVFDVLEREYF